MIYTFKCTKCKKTLEVVMPIGEYDIFKENAKCSECGEKLQRVFDLPSGISFKCGGTYNENNNVVASWQ